MNCQKCGKDVMMPFQCPYCKGQFCSEHRLPENHACPRIDYARAQPNEAVFTAFPNPTQRQKDRSYNYSVSYGNQAQKIRGHVYFGRKEIKHLTIAALLIVAIGFSMWYFAYPVSDWILNLGLMGIFAVLLTGSFLTHEVAHKVTAQKHGLWAEFRLTTWGMLLTFTSIFLPFKIISPGAMMISGNPNPYALVKIALSGPVTNIIFSSAFSATAFTIFLGFPMYNVFSLPFFLAAYINAFIAVFNLIPFALLDGAKIYRWNKKIWAVSFITSVALAIVTAIFILPLLFGY